MKFLRDAIFHAATHPVRNNFMTTVSGERIYVFRPRSPQAGRVLVSDIAHGLGMMCRWNGQIAYFYSVAQHSVYAYHIAREMGHGRTVQRACLFHDAPEAFMADLPSPIKAGILLYRATEDRLMSAIAQQVDVSMEPCVWAAVREIDMILLRAERVTLRCPTVYLCDGRGRNLTIDPANRGLDEIVDPDFYSWSPDTARECFTRAAAELAS